jgi:hypothetical protein
MPAPTNERQSLERERAELPSQLAAHQAQLDATPPENKGKARAARVANPEDAEADGGG